MSFSVCIASRGPDIGLWMTLSSVVRAHPSAELCVCINGRPWGEREQLLSDWGAKIVHSEDALTPPAARNRSATLATGDTLLFLDDHVLVGSDVFQPIQGRLLHFSYTTGPRSPYRYFHFYSIASMVEGDYRRSPHRHNPYRCASGPHGAMLISHAAWETLGGYWPDYIGFGGEEASFNLYAWSRGIETWLDPSVIIHHYSARSGARGYAKDINKDNYAMALRKLEPVLPELRAKFESEGVPF